METWDKLRTDALFNLSRGLNRSLVRPDWVSINLTLRCNLHCTMCTTCYDVPDELSREEILDIIDQISAWGVRILNPLGGEPFVRPDLVEILTYACRKDFYITLTTNGTLITPEAARGIAAIAYDRLHFNFSIDGFREVHDRIRGAGMLDRTLEGLKVLREADLAAGNPPRKVLVNCVVNDQNLDSIPAFLEWAKAQGFQGVQLLNLFNREAPKVPRELKFLWIDRPRWPALDDIVEQVRDFKNSTDPQQFLIVNSDHELDIMKRYYRGDLPPRDALCFAGWKELYINADGRTIMCDGKLDFLNGAFGNVREQTLQQLWESDALRSRREVVKACTSPCIQDCYLREGSDSLISIARKAGKKVWETVRNKLPRRGVSWVPLPGAILTLELSDVADIFPVDAAAGHKERLAQLLVPLTVPFERCYQDPFEYYELRNRGQLNFNRGFMGFEVVKKMVPELVAERVRFDALRLGHRGDPLLHPEFSLILAYLLDAIQNGGAAKSLQIETTGTLLNTEYVDIACRYADVPQQWHLRIPTVDAGTYRQIYAQDLFRNVLERVDYLATMVSRTSGGRISIVIDVEVSPENELEAAQIVSFWQKFMAARGLRAPQTVVGEWPVAWLEHPEECAGTHVIWFKRRDADGFRAQARLNQALQQVATTLSMDAVIDRDTGHPPRCGAPFKTPTVTWDGKLTVCDRDLFLQLKVGEVTTESIPHIWWEKEGIKTLREMVDRGELHRRTPCRDCHYPFSPNAPTISTEELSRIRSVSGRGFSV